MKLFGINFGSEIKQEPIKKTTAIVSPLQFGLETANYIGDDYIFNSSSISNLIQTQTKNIELLKFLYQNSPIHSSIITGKSRMVVGDGIVYDTTNLNETQKKIFETFLEATDGFSSLELISHKLEIDYQIYAWAALQITWDVTFKKIIKIKRINPEYLRFGRRNENDQIEEFYYSKDFTRNSSVYKTIPAFNIFNKTNTEQILLIENPLSIGKYFPTPNYISGLNWIQADVQIGVFHNSNIKNGFSPSLAIHFFNRPQDDNEAQELFQNLKAQYQGPKNAGRSMLFLNDDKENKVEVEAIPSTDLPEQFIAVKEQITENIVMAHGVTSGILFGIKTEGKLGTTNEFDNAYKIFEKTAITGDRSVLEYQLNRIMKINGFPTISFKPFKVFEDQIVEPTNINNTTN